MSDPTVPSGHYPPNPYAGAKLQGHTPEAYQAKRAEVALLELTAAQAAAADTDAVHASMATATTASEVTTGFVDPPWPSQISITYGGTATDLAAVADDIEGLDMDDQVIGETMPAATLNTGSTVVSTKIYKRLTKLNGAAHDGPLATRTVGYTDIKGLPAKLSGNTVLAAYKGDPWVKEGTAPTVTTSETVLASNSFDLNSALDGTRVKLYYMVP